MGCSLPGALSPHALPNSSSSFLAPFGMSAMYSFSSRMNWSVSDILSPPSLTGPEGFDAPGALYPYFTPPHQTSPHPTKPNHTLPKQNLTGLRAPIKLMFFLNDFLVFWH